MENTRIAKQDEPPCSTCDGFNSNKDVCLSVDSGLIKTLPHHTCRYHSLLRMKKKQEENNRVARLIAENSHYGKFGNKQNQ